jgi:hypothetical protein
VKVILNFIIPLIKLLIVGKLCYNEFDINLYEVFLSIIAISLELGAKYTMNHLLLGTMQWCNYLLYISLCFTNKKTVEP